MVKPQFQQPVVEMVFIRGKRGPLVSDPFHHHCQGIQNGKPDNGQGQNLALRGIGLGDGNGEHHQ
jgi:hypothetical protein